MVTIVECDFSKPSHCQALITLMNDYMADEMGGNQPPYSNEKAAQVLQGLEKHPAKLVLLAQLDGIFVGLANCFINFGTFAAKPFINIHDIVVLKEYRGKKIGQKLMEAITENAGKIGCAKITLEVREDNVYAQKLYKKMGYKDGNPPMYFWTKHL